MFFVYLQSLQAFRGRVVGGGRTARGWFGKTRYSRMGNVTGDRSSRRTNPSVCVCVYENMWFAFNSIEFSEKKFLLRFFLMWLLLVDSLMLIRGSVPGSRSSVAWGGEGVAGKAIRKIREIEGMAKLLWILTNSANESWALMAKMWIDIRFFFSSSYSFELVVYSFWRASPGICYKMEILYDLNVIALHSGCFGI